MRRVVVTGLGAITSLGQNIETSWKNLLAGRSGIKKIPASLFSTEDLRCKIAGYISTPEEDNELGIDLPGKVGRIASSVDRFIQLAVAASEEAMLSSGWSAETEDEQNRAGVLIGSGIGGLITIEQNALKLKEMGARRISPYFIPASLVNLISGHVSIKYKMKGPNISIVSACASGAHSIGEAARIIQTNDADIMIAGGAEAAICPLGIAGFAAARTLSTKYNDDPTRASRPWDNGRDGFVMGEGAGIVVLEELEHAKKRGANIIAELVGYGLSGDAYHITAPDDQGDGGYRAMKMAIAKSGIRHEDIGHLNAHSTSTPVGDPIEIAAIKRLFGDNPDIIVSANKSAIGHLLGAAGSVEALFSVMSLRDQIVPPTLNLEEIDDRCKGIKIATSAVEKKMDVVLSNSFGFGGTNSALIFKKFDG